LIKTEYLKIIYFHALGYMQLDIFCSYSLLSFSCDQVLNTAVLRLCLIFICVCVCLCARARAREYTTLQAIATSSAHNWDKHRSNTF